MGKLWIFALIISIVLISFVYALSLKQESSLTRAEKDIILTKLKFSDKIEDEVISQLEDKDKIRVIVSLDNSNLYKLKKLSKIKPKIKENQNKVLKNIPGLRVIYQYNNINSLAVEVDARDLEKLEAFGVVKKISEDKEMHIFLNDSVPQIQANESWGLGYDGEGQTVCIIDTGVDYAHPAIGSLSCSLNQQEAILSPINESQHPYPDPYDENWTITKPGYSNIAVYFEKIELIKSGSGNDFSYIEILDKNNKVVQVIKSELNPEEPYCENLESRWSDIVPGDTIKIRLFGNAGVGESLGCFGFNATKVKNVSWQGNCGSFIGGYDFVNNDNDPMDDHSHGTHVAGIITSNDTKYKGVAPNASIFAVKSCGSNGNCQSSNVIAGIDYCIDTKDTYDIKIISMSLGGDTKFTSNCDSDPVASAVNTAVNSAGLFVSVASGNHNWDNGISSPACASKATSVGAVDKSDNFWSGSNRGSLLDLLAPGINIVSANITLFSLFTMKSGTSMATPHVAGLAALMLQKNPDLTPAQIEQIMKDTGKNITYESITYPRINASKAVRNVPEPETISITLDFSSISFGNVNPSETKMISNYNITIDGVTNVNVDLYHKGTNFTVNYQNISIQNMKWINDSTNYANAFSMKEAYDKNVINIKPGTYLNMTYWLSIPAGQAAASDYTSSITIKAVKTGNLP